MKTKYKGKEVDPIIIKLRLNYYSLISTKHIV